MSIVIEKTSVNKIGNQIIENTKDFQSEIQKFLAIIEKIDLAWDGSDSLKYLNILKEKYVVGLNELNDTIREYGIYLQNVSEAYDLLDEVFASKNINV